MPWWNDRLTRLRKRCRRFFNRARNRDKVCKRLGLPLEDRNWDVYRRVLKDYNKQVRKTRQESFMAFVGQVDSMHQRFKVT